MYPAIDNPARCKIRANVHSLRVKNMSAAEMHPEFCAVYDQNIMSEGTVRQWCGMFKDLRTDVHDEERNGWVSVVSDLVQSIDQKFFERQHFTISEVSCEFPQISRTVFYKIITVTLGCQVSESAHRCTQNAENSFGFDFFRAIPRRR
jgi:hypothetical protein